MAKGDPMPAKKPAPPARPSRSEAEDAVRVLIRWAGDDPKREGLRDTPGRVVNAYEEFFAGYEQDPREVLARTFSEVEAYDERSVMNDIRFGSDCENHMGAALAKRPMGY